MNELFSKEKTTAHGEAVKAITVTLLETMVIANAIKEAFGNDAALVEWQETAKKLQAIEDKIDSQIGRDPDIDWSSLNAEGRAEELIFVTAEQCEFIADALQYSTSQGLVPGTFDAVKFAEWTELATVLAARDSSRELED